MNQITSKQNDYFETSDLPLCTTLCCFGYEIDSISKQERKATFLIIKDERLESLVKKYWTHQLQVEPMSFFNFLKEIKSRIYNI